MQRKEFVRKVVIFCLLFTGWLTLRWGVGWAYYEIAIHEIGHYITACVVTGEAPDEIVIENDSGYIYVSAPMSPVQRFIITFWGLGATNLVTLALFFVLSNTKLWEWAGLPLAAYIAQAATAFYFDFSLDFPYAPRVMPIIITIVWLVLAFFIAKWLFKKNKEGSIWHHRTNSKAQSTAGQTRPVTSAAATNSPMRSGRGSLTLSRRSEELLRALSSARTASRTTGTR